MTSKFGTELQAGLHKSIGFFEDDNMINLSMFMYNNLEERIYKKISFRIFLITFFVGYGIIAAIFFLIPFQSGGMRIYMIIIVGLAAFAVITTIIQDKYDSRHLVYHATVFSFNKTKKTVSVSSTIHDIQPAFLARGISPSKIIYGEFPIDAASKFQLSREHRTKYTGGVRHEKGELVFTNLIMLFGGLGSTNIYLKVFGYSFFSANRLIEKDQVQSAMLHDNLIKYDNLTVSLNMITKHIINTNNALENKPSNSTVQRPTSTYNPLD